VTALSCKHANEATIGPALCTGGERDLVAVGGGGPAGIEALLGHRVGQGARQVNGEGRLPFETRQQGAERRRYQRLPARRGWQYALL